MMPEDIQNGMAIVFRARMEEGDLNSETFSARMLSSWGIYVYRFKRTNILDRQAGTSAETVHTRSDKIPHSHDMRYESPEYDKWLDLQGRVMDLSGKGNEIRFETQFADKVVAFDMELEKNQNLGPVASFRNFRYGSHERHTFDVYLPSGDHQPPFPAVMRIHGGGWTAGNKRDLLEAAPLLSKGIAYVSVNYRLSQDAKKDGVTPIMAGPILDAARALQTLRYHADKFNIDKKRIGLTGGSAGGYTALWIATHDDLADPESDDPILRESTRVSCAANSVPMCQFPPWLNLSNIPEKHRDVAEYYIQQCLGFWARHFDVSPEELKSAEPESPLRRRINRFSPIMLVTPDDPPLLFDYLYWDWWNISEKETVRAHHPINGLPIKVAYEKLGKECILLGVGLPAPEKYYPGPAGETIKPKEENNKYKKGEAVVQFFSDKLLK